MAAFHSGERFLIAPRLFLYCEMTMMFMCHYEEREDTVNCVEDDNLFLAGCRRRSARVQQKLGHVAIERRSCGIESGSQGLHR